MAPILVVEDLKKTYPGTRKSPPVEALRGISFSVEQGEFFGLLGPNGAGKSTTIGCITTLVRPTSGRISVAGSDVIARPSEAKQRIARAVAAAVPSGCSLVINIGTTTEAIAHELLRHKGLRVITNNLNVAAILSDNPECEVIVAGGIVRSRDRGIVGEATIDFIRQFKVDIGLIGISAIEGDGSLRDFDYREVKVARAIIEHSREVWLAADHSKFNRPAMVELARLDEIDMLFTDAAPPAPFPDLLAAAGVGCVTCEDSPP